MARKFKVGDKVKIVKDNGETGNIAWHGFRLGRVGTVKTTEHDLHDCCPYGVQIRNECDVEYFNARELELVKRKGK